MDELKLTNEEALVYEKLLLAKEMIQIMLPLEEPTKWMEALIVHAIQIFRQIEEEEKDRPLEDRLKALEEKKKQIYKDEEERLLRVKQQQEKVEQKNIEKQREKDIKTFADKDFVREKWIKRLKKVVPEEILTEGQEYCQVIGTLKDNAEKCRDFLLEMIKERKDLRLVLKPHKEGEHYLLIKSKKKTLI